MRVVLSRRLLLLSCVMVSALSLAAAGTQQEKPSESAVEIDLFHNDFSNALRQARHDYRLRDERAAAAELRKAEAWLDQASKHAPPSVENKLKISAAEFDGLAAALESGDLGAAESINRSTAKAGQSVSEWHYLEAKDSLGNKDEAAATRHLKAATNYLRDAAASVDYDYSADTVGLLHELDKNKTTLDGATAVAPRRLKEQVEGLEIAIRELDAALTSPKRH